MTGEERKLLNKTLEEIHSLIRLNNMSDFRTIKEISLEKAQFKILSDYLYRNRVYKDPMQLAKIENGEFDYQGLKVKRRGVL